MGKNPFEGFDLTGFWEENNEYILENYVSNPPSDVLINEIESELGYKLPESYIFLMKQQNGGMPINSCFPTPEPTNWAPDHFEIAGIMGIGRDKPFSICGELGSQFMIEEWGYPPIGVAICDTPSAGHEMIFLDYRKCGSKGEPQVVHIDQESNYEITFLANDFESFVRGLVHPDAYDEVFDGSISLDDVEIFLDEGLL